MSTEIWHQHFVNEVETSLGKSFPDYLLSDSLRQLIDPGTTESGELPDLFARITEIIAAADENELPDPRNKVTTGLGALSVIVAFLEPEDLDSAVAALRKHSEELGDVPSILPIRMLNDGVSVESAVRFSAVAPVEAAGNVLKALEGLDPDSTRIYIDGVIELNDVDVASKEEIARRYAARLTEIKNNIDW